MRQGDIQLGAPYVSFSGTSAELAALTGVLPGALAWDTDLETTVQYDGVSWSPMGGGSATWGGITGTLSDQTDLQAALDGKADASEPIAAAHIADTSAAHAASAIANTPAGNISSTDVQAALNELDTEKALVSEPIAAAHIANGTAAHAGSAISNTPAGNIAATTVQAALNELDSEKIPTTYLDTDGTLAANSDSKIATQKATKTYVDNAVTGLLDFKGSTNCSANPNYPAALKGDAYIVSAAGKIGGASGKSVDISDVYFATADNAGGTEASVGTSWSVLEHNLVGALLSANNLSDVASTSTARSNLGLGTAATLASDTDGTLAANSDSNIATQKAVKTYADALVVGLLDYKGTIDASGNPNWPSALKGDCYIVSVAGRLGGIGGRHVDVGAFALAIADNAGGTDGTVGANWKVLLPDSAILVAIAGLTMANDKMIYFTSSAAAAMADLTAAGRALIDDADAAAQRTTLGLGTAATHADSDYAPAAKGVTNGDTHNHVGGDGAALNYSDTIGAFLNGAIVPGSTTHSACPWKTTTNTTTNSVPWPEGGTLSDLNVRISTTQPASGTGSLVITLFVNGSATSLVVTIANGSTQGTYSDSTHTANISAGDLVRWDIVNNASGNSAAITAITMKLTKQTT